MKHYFKVTNRQWFGLFISILISVLIWLNMTLIFNNNYYKNEEFKINKYHKCGLVISLLIGALTWFRTVNIVDK